MIEALQLAILDTIRAAGWTTANSAVMGPGPMGAGQPPPFKGAWFCAVQQGPQSSDMMNALNTYDGFTLTLTARFDAVPIDQVGSKLLVGRLLEEAQRKTNFNVQARRLRDLLHMDWYTIGAANNKMLEIEPDAYIIHGFCEPAHFTGMSDVQLVTGEWFGAPPPENEGLFFQGIKADLSFDGARRLQPIAEYV